MTSISTGTGIAPFNGNWGNLRGAVYKWNDLSLKNDGASSPAPSISFPMMKSLDFNFARVDGLDWGYLESSPSTYNFLLSQVAQAGDSDGIYLDYLFGGNFNHFPVSITSQYSSSSAFFSAWWQDSTVPGGTYSGIPLWEAMFQGLWKPVLQTIGSHASSVGVGLWNEPSGLPSNSMQVLHSYYEYETQRIRNISGIATVFQLNVADANGGGGDIPAVAPTSDLKPYTFEGHMYSYSSTVLASWAHGASQAGAYSFVGETHLLDTNFYTQVHNQGFAVNYYRWSCDSLLDSNCQPTSTAQQLSQIYGQTWGPP